MSIAPGYRGTNTIMQELEARMGEIERDPRFIVFGPGPPNTEDDEEAILSQLQKIKKVVMNSVTAKVKFIRYETTGYRNKIDPKGPWEPSNIQVKEQRTVVLQPVYGNSEENKKFFEATPTGEIKLGIINQEAWPFFELDKEYYIDFRPAE